MILSIQRMPADNVFPAGFPPPSPFSFLPSNPLPFRAGTEQGSRQAPRVASSRVERCSPKSVFDILTYIQFKVPRPAHPA